jgi:hypothetical protein
MGALPYSVEVTLFTGDGVGRRFTNAVVESEECR